MPHGPLYSDYGAPAMKRAYWPNMFWSMGIVVALALIFIGTSWYTQRDHGKIDVATKATQADTTVAVLEPPPKEESKPASRSGHGLNPYEHQHQGFAGFDGYRILRDIPEEPAADTPLILSHVPAPQEMDTLSYTDLVRDTGAGVYAPEYSEWNYLPEDTAPRVHVNRDVEAIRKELPKTPWIAKENKREGMAKILAYIDSTGSFAIYGARRQDRADSSGTYLDIDTIRIQLVPFLDDATSTYFTVLEEDPCGYGFAQALLKVLPEWKFRPKIENNVPVGSFVIIGFDFCDMKKNPDCRQIVLQTMHSTS